MTHWQIHSCRFNIGPRPNQQNRTPFQQIGWLKMTTIKSATASIQKQTHKTGDCFDKTRVGGQQPLQRDQVCPPAIASRVICSLPPAHSSRELKHLKMKDYFKHSLLSSKIIFIHSMNSRRPTQRAQRKLPGQATSRGRCLGYKHHWHWKNIIYQSLP